MDVLDIIEGNINRFLNRNQNISEKRLLICLSCPLYSTKFGGLCNSKLWLNPLTGEVSIEEKDGYKRGCSCIIRSKVRAKNAKCPAGKW